MFVITNNEKEHIQMMKLHWLLFDIFIIKVKRKNLVGHLTLYLIDPWININHKYAKILIIFLKIMKSVFKLLNQSEMQGYIFFTVHKILFSQCVKMCKIICLNLTLPQIHFHLECCYDLKHCIGKILFFTRSCIFNLFKWVV